MKKMVGQNLTIITCSMKFHDPFLLCNYEEMRKYDSGIKWIIVNNDSSPLSISNFQDADPNLSVINGPKLDNKFGRVAVGVQHSSALKLAAAKVGTEFVLILDPDFIVLDWNYIMDFCANKLDVGYKAVATPWFVSWFSKKTKSIAPHFVLARTSLLNAEFPWYPIDLIPAEWRELSKPKDRKYRKFLQKNPLINLVAKIVLNRRRINTEFDTLGETFHMGEKGEVLFVDIYATRIQLKKISPHLSTRLGRYLEKLIPARYSYFANSVKLLTFELNSNCENIEHYGTEGNIWAVHMRGFGSGKLMANDRSSLAYFSNHLAFLTGNRRKLLLN
jgi:hypothetical protein